MILYKPADAIRLLEISKPYFYKLIDLGYLKKIFPSYLPKDSKEYRISDRNIAAVKKLLNSDDWKRGKSKLPKEKKGAA